MHTFIWIEEMLNLRIDEKLAFSVKGGKKKSIELPPDRICLHVYGQELFLIGTSYLQLAGFLDSSKKMKDQMQITQRIHAKQYLVSIGDTQESLFCLLQVSLFPVSYKHKHKVINIKNTDEVIANVTRPQGWKYGLGTPYPRAWDPKLVLGPGTSSRMKEALLC